MPRSFDEVPKLTALVCVICITLFATIHTQAGAVTNEVLRNYGAPQGIEVWNGAWWGLLTSPLVHLEVWHLLFNLYWFWMLGGTLEQSVSAWKWIAFFIGAAWVSSGVELALGNAGIGLSGVGYALFGLGWVAGGELPKLKEILSEQVIRGFLIWGVACVFLDALNILRIANGAHFGGCAFGAAVGALWVTKKLRPLAGAGLAALVAVSIGALFWCPWEPEWNAAQAEKAEERGDLQQAALYYRRSLGGDVNPEWVWFNLSIVYGELKDPENFRTAVSELRQLNAQDADNMEQEYGPALNLPEVPTSP